MKEHRFPYNWTLKDAKFTKDKGKVFSCFACGGGSTMGYKLAGFDVIGHNDIDKKMKIRCASDNEDIIDIYKSFLGERGSDTCKKYLHRGYNVENK